MTQYDVCVTERLERVVSITAQSPEEAERIAHDLWRKATLLLDADDFTGVEFHAEQKNLEEAKND